MLLRKPGKVSWVTAAPPMTREKTSVAVVMLSTSPSVRMVPIMPEATP